MDINELDDLGLLRTEVAPPQLAWLTDEEKHLLVLVHLAGADGMHQRQVRRLLGQRQEALVRLEFHELLAWERDPSGRPMFLVATWKGQEAAEVLLKVARNTCGKPPLFRNG